MPRNHQRRRALIRRSKDARNLRRRFINLCVQFEIADGDNAGWRTQPYGGLWDSFYSVDEAGHPVGKFVSVWDPARGGWFGPDGEPAKPAKPKVIKVAQQSIKAIQDWTHQTMLVLGGRRSGKTTGTLAPKILVLLIVFAGLPGCVLSPTYRQSMNVWRALTRLAPANWWAHKNKTDRRLRAINGAEVVLLSADRDDSSRSEGCAWQVNDERQDIGEHAAGNARLSASEARGPAAHIVIETGTIKPELREHYDRVMASAKGAVYHMDSYGNPFIDHSFLDDAREFLDEEMIERELHARWPTPTGIIYGRQFRDELIKSHPARGFEDVTAAFLNDHFGGPAPYGEDAAQWFVSIDPPGHAALWKFYRNDVMHLVHEVLVGADGDGGDVRTLADRCRALCGKATAFVVFDPHDNKWDSDVTKYFRIAGRFRFVSMRRVPVEYRLTAVRARLEREKLIVDPRCVHAIEVLQNHKYLADGSGKPDKTQTYSRSYQRESKKVQLVHLADAIGYGVYKLYPAQYDYERREKAA